MIDMTKREVIAMHCMASCAAQGITLQFLRSQTSLTLAEWHARDAVTYADALLHELDKTQKTE